MYYFLVPAGFALMLFYGAWVERAAQNARDSKFLAGSGAVASVATLAMAAYGL